MLLVLVLAVLYFGFMELLMIDASRELSEARRFRARIVALALAENGAELAAMRMVQTRRDAAPPSEVDWQGTISGTIDMTGAEFPITFTIIGDGRSSGPESAKVTVTLEGRIYRPALPDPPEPERVQILFARHTQ